MTRIHAITLLALGLSSASGAHAQLWQIQFNDQVKPTSSYTTSTVTSNGQRSVYRRYSGGRELAAVPLADQDLTFTPGALSDLNSPNHPVRGSDGPVGILSTYVPLSAEQGGYKIERPGGGTIHFKGDGTQELSIDGDFQVVPYFGLPNSETATLIVLGQLSGTVFVRTPQGAEAAPTTASLNAQMSFDGIGFSNITAHRQANTGGSGPDTARGLTVHEGGQAGQFFSKQSARMLIPGFPSNQVFKPQNFYFIKKVPIMTPIGFSVTADLTATKNQGGPGDHAAAILANQTAVLIPVPGAPVDPFYSLSRFRFNLDDKSVSIEHPLKGLGLYSGPGQVQPDGAITPEFTIDFTGFRPEVEHVIAEGSYRPDDALRGLVISYEGIAFPHTSDGVHHFTGGAIEFRDPDDGSLRAAARIEHLRADPRIQSFLGHISDFSLSSFPGGQTSPIAQAFARYGGEITFDPRLIAASNGFTQPVEMDDPYAVIGTPVVPGDASDDGMVDFRDFVILYDHFGQAGTRLDGDFDYDRLVTFADFQLLERYFGHSMTSSTPLSPTSAQVAAMEAFVAARVPEPSWFFAATAVIGWLARTPRRRTRRA